MSYYILNNKHTIPGFFFRAIASWVIALSAMSLLLLVGWGLSALMHLNLLKLLPGPLMVFLDLCGAYAGIGGICLYVTMWVYWIAVERSPILPRISWLLALLLGLHYGALVYAIFVWKRRLAKVGGPQPIPGASVIN